MKDKCPLNRQTGSADQADEPLLHWLPEQIQGRFKRPINDAVSVINFNRRGLLLFLFHEATHD